MCGIAGLLSSSSAFDSAIVVEKMIDCIKHRGPDSGGYLIEPPIYLGHRRLSILDLSPCSNQPFASDDRRYHIIFNGEIYNFQEVKSSMPEHTFRSTGDTEVILAAYIKYGPACLDRFAGMFALAIWDSQKKELFLARDRLGVKPLYYCKLPGGILFASEIRAILASGMVGRQLNRSSASELLEFQSVGSADSIVEGISALDAGCYAIVSETAFDVHRYWNIFKTSARFDYRDRTAVKTRINHLLHQAVQRRMVSDVPVAAFLSGGIDSSAVVALMASVATEPVNTFTIGFEDKRFDESQYAEQIAQKYKTNHETIVLRPESFLDELIPALNSMDTPSGDGINSYVVSKAIRKQGIIVALSGTGGDELFAGYPFFKTYFRLKKWSLAFNASQPLRAIGKKLIGGTSTRSHRLKELLDLKTIDLPAFYPIVRQIVTPRMINACTHLSVSRPSAIEGILSRNEREISNLPVLSQISVAEYLGYTKNTLLTDMDQMSMAVSLEVREPFFDHDLIEFVLNVPDVIKYPKYPKSLLVESLGDLLPHNIIHRKKQGFVLPWDKWMRNELSSFCDTHIRAIAQRRFIKKEELKAYWNRFLNGDASVRWSEMWVFIVLEYWMQRNNVE